MRRGPSIAVVAILALTIVLAQAVAYDPSTIATTESHGARAVEISEPGPASMESANDVIPLRGGSREGTILWHRHFDDAIYTSMGISDPAAMASAGTYWMPPIHVETTPLAGDGTAAWTYAGTKLFVDMCRGGEHIAAVDFDDSDSTAVIRAWHAGSSTPLWTYVVHPCRSLTYQGWASRKPIQVSDDGSTIAAAIVMYTDEGQRGRLFVFDADSGTPTDDYDFPDGNVVATAISSTGDFIAMAGWPTIYVYDRELSALRWSGPIYSGNDALAISGDGTYLAWGWTNFYLRQWNGSTYTSAWTQSGAGSYVGQCALSTDESTLALSWDNGSSFPNEVVVRLYSLPSLELLWEYDYDGGAPKQPRTDGSGGRQTREHVDMPSAMIFSPSGEHLAVGSWGGSFPEIHIFGRSAPEPLFTLDTTGSIFDIDVVTAPDGTAYASACGKNVHAGQGGRGGDLYAIEIPAEPTDVADTDGAHTGFGLRGSVPNPFNPVTRIAYALSHSGQVRLTVHDPAGRLIRSLDIGRREAGQHTIGWDGISDVGAPVASGVYFVRLRSAGRTSTMKLVLSR